MKKKKTLLPVYSYSTWHIAPLFVYQNLMPIDAAQCLTFSSTLLSVVCECIYRRFLFFFVVFVILFVYRLLCFAANYFRFFFSFLLPSLWFASFCFFFFSSVFMVRFFSFFFLLHQFYSYCVVFVFFSFFCSMMYKNKMGKW